MLFRTHRRRGQVSLAVAADVLEDRKVPVAIASVVTAAEFADLAALFKKAGQVDAAKVSQASAVKGAERACPPALCINDVCVVEGDYGQRYATFKVTLSKPSCEHVKVKVETRDGTACSPQDYCGICETLCFRPGETCKTVTVKIHGDKCVECDETFYVNLSCAENATIADGQGRGTIVNDDCYPPPRHDEDRYCLK